MLRIVFQCPGEDKLRIVQQGLCVLSERLRRRGDLSFTLYNTNKIASGAVSMEMVEIHNDAENVFSASLDQVISSVGQTSAQMDEELLQQSPDKPESISPDAYGMFKGRLISAVPSALCFIVRQSSPGRPLQNDATPSMMRFQYDGEGISMALDMLSQLADLAMKLPGVVACLVQGMDHYSSHAALLFLFATDNDLYMFVQDKQTRLLGLASSRALDGLKLSLEGTPTTFAQQVYREFSEYLLQ